MLTGPGAEDSACVDLEEEWPTSAQVPPPNPLPPNLSLLFTLGIVLFLFNIIPVLMFYIPH